MMANAASTQRLARSSRSPGLMFPLVNIAAASSTRLTMMSDDQRRMCEEGGESALAQDSEAKKDQAREERDQQQLPISRHRVVFRCYLPVASRERLSQVRRFMREAHALVSLGGIAGAADGIE